MRANYEESKRFVPSAAVIVALLLPVFVGDRTLVLIIPAILWAIAAIGWTAIYRTGQFSMGQAAFMAIGAYTSAILTASPAEATGIVSTVFHLPVLVGVLMGGLVAGLIALLVGSATLKLGGLYFVIVTLAFSELVRVLALNEPTLFGGVNGITSPDPSAFGLDFTSSRISYYYLVLAALLVTAGVFWRIDRSRLGRLFRAVSSNPNLASQSGIQLMKYRLIAFTVAGVFAGIAGALFTHYLRVVTPTLFGFSESVMILIMVVVGGTRGAVAGPVVGALILSPLGSYLTSKLQGANLLVFGGLVVLVSFFLVDGVISIPDLMKYRFFDQRVGPRARMRGSIDSREKAQSHGGEE